MAVIVSEAGARELIREAPAVGFLSDAFNHIKAIGASPPPKCCFSGQVLPRSWLMMTSSGVDAIAGLVAAARNGRIWDREPKVRNLQ